MASSLSSFRSFSFVSRTFSRTFVQRLKTAVIFQTVRVPSLSICRKCSSKSENVKAPGLGEHQHHRPRHENWARDLIFSLNAGQRRKLMDELATFEKAKVRRLQVSSDKHGVQDESLLSHDGLYQVHGEGDKKRTKSKGVELPKLTISQKRQLAIFSGLPFVGFGTLDNIVMITAGEYIDNTFGAILGLSTMAAAALGNMVSDVAGIGTAGYVEEMASKVGILPPELSPEQVDLKSTKLISTLGRMVGVAIGCTIGMLPLLLIKREEEEETDSEKDNKQTDSNKEGTEK